MESFIRSSEFDRIAEKLSYFYDDLLIQIFFEGSEIRSVWDSEKEEYYFSVVDVVEALTDLGEIATRELAKKRKPYGLEENKKVAQMGGHAC